jgi:iron complex outermembrane receptor protein
MVDHFMLRRVLGRASSYRVLGLALSGVGVMLATTPLAAPAQAQSVTPQSAPTVGTAATGFTPPANLDLGAVLSTGTGNAADLTTTPGTAPYNAPSLTPLNSVQPTSVVSQQTIQNQLSSTQSYADIARLTPSVSLISPNGPGLGEAAGPTIRGFQDGQYNVTIDGIPIGDSNDFTHHTTSFFTNDEIGQLIVDRGPGTAETVGDATFGGTMSIRTINPAATTTLTPYGSYGSYDTGVEGLRIDTGAIQAANGTTGVFNIENDNSNGALTYSHQDRTNFFGKIIVPVGNSTTVTFMADYNRLYQNPVYGATLGEMAAYGHNYNLNNNPDSQDYWRYNYDRITTDMEYVDVASHLADGWEYDGKVYTYAYYHADNNGLDVNDDSGTGEALNEVVLSPGGATTAGVPGETFFMNYRSVGTIQRLQKDFAWGDIKLGAWFDHQVNTRFLAENDLSDGNADNYNDSADGFSNADLAAANNNYGQIDRLQHNQLYTFQPYAQLDWQPIQNLTLTGGVKYAFFRRTLDAQVQQTTEAEIGYQHDWGKFLPSFEAKYNFSPNFSTYAQVAEGFLAPNLNTFYVDDPNNSAEEPETTWSYQTGFAYQSRHLALGGDVYLVHFMNFINHTGSGVNEVYYNDGGAVYKGIEGEATYTFDNGFSLFANGGLNKANSTATNDYIAEAPQFTSNAGIIYNKNGIYASIIDQLTGGEYDSNGTGNGGTTLANSRAPGAWYDPYNVVNLAAGYTFNHINPHVKQIRVKLNLDNITNQQQIIFSPGQVGPNSEDLCYVLPGVSAFVTVSMPIGF